MNHYRKTRVNHYLKHTKKPGCPFCRPETVSGAVSKNKLVMVIPNITFYDLWELYDVTDHLMVVPLRHIESLNDLTKEEKLAIMDVAAEYEEKGYSVYARGVGFVKRSQKHQHTHLIKAKNKKPRFALFIQKPYFLIKK